MEEEKKFEEKKKIFGFRSQKKWKMVIAVFYYFIWAKDYSTIYKYVFDTILEKFEDLCYMIAYFSPFLLLSDFSKDIRKNIPLLNQNKKGKTVLFFIILIVVLTFSSTMATMTFHTEEYEEQIKIEQERLEQEEEAKKEAEEKAKKEAEEKAKKEAEEKEKKEAEDKAKKEAEEKAKKEAEEKEKKEAEEKAKKEAEAQAKKEKEEKAKAEKEHKEYIAKMKKEGLANLKKIRKAYKNNSLNADDTYKGNRYVLYAELVSIDESGFLDKLFNDIEVLVIYKDGNTISNAWCDFNDTERDKLKKYKKGDYILFSGECFNSGNYSNCEIIE